MATRSGLVSYTGDSEISDSEDERVSTGHTPPGIAMQGLGIPTSRSHHESTPPLSLVPQVIISAPSTGLVAYYGEEDEGDPNDSRELEDVFKQPHVRRRSSENRQVRQAREEAPVIRVTSEDLGDSRPLFLPLSEVQLPPEPIGKCPQELQGKIINLLKKKEQLGIDLNTNIQSRKDYRNPSIYEKLVQFCDLDEFGSNYPEHLFNPREWGEESFYDNLLKAQKKAYEKKERAKLDRTKVEFVTGTKRPATAGVGPEPVKKARKSKWDVSNEPGSRGSSPGKEKTSGVGAQAIAQANQMTKELSKLAK